MKTSDELSDTLPLLSYLGITYSKNEVAESVRKDAKFDKQYLEGKYGADPYLKKIIEWGTVNG